MEKREKRLVAYWDKVKGTLLSGTSPVGIVVICADNSIRNEFVYGTLEKFMGIVCVVSAACSDERLKAALKGSSTVCVSLTPEDSCNHSKRHEIVTMLKKSGIKTVHGIYLPVATAKFPETQPIIRALDANPPTADGFGGFVIV